MINITWDPDKGRLLRKDLTRGGIGFEDCVVALEEGRILTDIPNPNSHYPRQHLFILEINQYAYVVPYVESEDGLFLKTFFPSRKHTAQYLR